ncbi:hypothetical protein FALCPG4_009564 [Fusarium falciforme]
MKQTDSASTFCGAVSSSYITAFSSHDTILLFFGWLHWAFVDGLISLFSYFPGLSFYFLLHSDGLILGLFFLAWLETSHGMTTQNMDIGYILDQHMLKASRPFWMVGFFFLSAGLSDATGIGFWLLDHFCWSFLLFTSWTPFLRLGDPFF